MKPLSHERQTIALSSLIAESKDGEWGKGEEFKESVLMRAIRGTDFEQVRVGMFNDVPKRFITAKAAERKKLMPDDIIIEAAGGTKNQPTGRTVFINKRLLESSDVPFICASFSRFIRINPQKADPLFVFWYLQYLYKSDRLSKYHTQHTGVGRFQWTVFKESPDISLPSIQEQKRVASVLSAFDDLIENNTKRIKNLEDMARLIYREWFVHYRFPGHENITMVDSGTELGKVPDGWKTRKLGDVIELAYGKALKEDERKPGINAVYGSSGKVGYHDVPLTSGPGIVVGRKGNVGSIHWVSEDFWPIDTTFYVKTEIPLHFCFFALQHQHFISSDVAVPGLNRNQAYLNDFLVPEDCLVKKFTAQITSFFQQIEILSKQNNLLRQARDLLLPKLMSGQIDLSSEAAPKPKKDVFKDAVIFACTIDLSSDENFFPTHLRAVKSIYFVDRFSGINPTEKYAEHTFGPYDPKSTHAGGEKLALKKSYVQRVSGGFRTGKNLGEAKKYPYPEVEIARKVMPLLRYRTDDELEILATVDFILYKQLMGRERPTAETVFAYIQSSEVWKEKISRLALNVSKIANAMKELRGFIEYGLIYPKN